jgi:hypothetical protein
MPRSNVPTPAGGDCFAAAAKFIRDQSVSEYARDYRLIHGNLAQLRQDAPVNHAWVELHDVVFEVSNGQNHVFPRDKYYESNGVTTVREYTSDEAIVLMIQHGHWGPWD